MALAAAAVIGHHGLSGPPGPISRSPLHRENGCRSLSERWGPTRNPSGIQWVRLGDISPDLRRAVLAAEDQRFLAHHGFDFTEMEEVIHGFLNGGAIRGASTITMQAARTVFLWPGRTLLRKAAEAYYTVLIEWTWTKERILEVYLNTVDWGDGCAGVRAAAARYFGVEPCEINRSQAALLASILPNPRRWSASKPSPQVLARKDKIMKDLDLMPLLPRPQGSDPPSPQGYRLGRIYTNRMESRLEA